ncbi:hypothetical protein [Thermofilum sp.]|jgi:hypothetical protein|uniref:hypothetical protein n=1 Tax=Thermofilum sp. TaxID=1961369 RepID=UPI0025830ADB|nr:hypothetical protein [Thermofilum sp.]
MSRPKAILLLSIIVALVAIALLSVTTFGNEPRNPSPNPCLAKTVTAPIRPVFGRLLGQ